MRKIRFFTLAGFIPLIFISPIFGQEYKYISMPTTDAVWNVFYRQPASYNYENKIYSTAGDTLINNETWTKIVLANSINETIYQGAYLETDKIIRFCSPNGDIDTLYDFNVNLGDTIFFFNLGRDTNFWWSDTVLVVDKIDSVFIENNFRRQIKFKGIGGGAMQWIIETWIEGIGSLHGILFPFNFRAFMTEMQEAEDLTCFFENNNLLWQDKSYKTCEVVKINEFVINNKIEVYPNPVSQYLTIKTDDFLSLNIEIFDIYGRKIFATELKENTNILNLSDWINGVYLLRIQANNSVSYKKIIKI